VQVVVGQMKQELQQLTYLFQLFCLLLLPLEQVLKMKQKVLL
jgi:hypothetical protein